MFEFNKDAKTRDEMIFGEYDESKYMGGVRRFEGMSLDLLKELMGKGYVDPEESQNNSPTIEEFIDYAEAWGGYVFDGYVVSPKRDDYRVSVETISKEGPVYTDELKAFINEFRFADEFYIDGSLYAWWD